MEKEPSGEEFEECSLLLHMDLLSEEFDEPLDDESSQKEETCNTNQESLPENEEAEKHASDGASLFSMEISMQLSDGNDMVLSMQRGEKKIREHLNVQESLMEMKKDKGQQKKTAHMEIKQSTTDAAKCTIKKKAVKSIMEQKQNVVKINSGKMPMMGDGFIRKKTSDEKNSKDRVSSKMVMARCSPKNKQDIGFIETAKKSCKTRKRESFMEFQYSKESMSLMYSEDSMKRGNGSNMGSSMGITDCMNGKKDRSMKMGI